MLRNWECRVVFDAPETTDAKKEERVSARTTVVFTDYRETADAYIERVAADRKPLGAGATVVATNDAMIRLMVSSNEAGTLRVKALLDLIEGADRAMSAKLAAIRGANALAADKAGDYDARSPRVKSTTGPTRDRPPRLRDRSLRVAAALPPRRRRHRSTRGPAAGCHMDIPRVERA